MAKRRPEADDLLRMAEHRRRMRALAKVAETAGRVAASGELRHLQAVPGATGADLDAPAVRPGPADATEPETPVVVSLAAARARRAGHPAGSNRP